MAESEAELVSRAAAGNREAFGSLAESCRPWVLGLCFRLVADRSAAEDLVQETFLRAFRDLKQLRDRERFRPWLSRIALTACRMYLRALRARPEAARPDDHTRACMRTSEDAPFGIDQALAQLDAESRRMLMPFYGEGLSPTEVGEVCALSAAAVKSRLHRARERLQKELLAMMTEEQKARLGLAEEEPWVPRTILLVEPEDDLRRSLREALTAAGYEVVELPTGEAALAVIAEHRGQMLILDKHCIEPNWIEVLTLVKADAWSRENVPVGVFGDDPANGRDVLLAWQAGAQLYLTRPPRPEEVVNFVNRLARLWPHECGQAPCDT